MLAIGGRGGGRPAFGAGLVNSGQGAGEVFAQFLEGSGQGFDPRDQNIIVIGLWKGKIRQPQSFAQASANAVADDGITDLFGDGEAEAWGFSRSCCVFDLALAGLKDKTALMLAPPLGGGDEIDALLQAQRKRPWAFTLGRCKIFAVAGTDLSGTGLSRANHGEDARVARHDFKPKGACGRAHGGRR